MKKFLLFLFLTSFCFGSGQNLSLTELIKFQKGTLVDFEESLTAKGWVLMDDSVGLNNKKLSSLSFQYKHPSDNSNFAFIGYLYDDSGVRISMTFIKKEKYIEYLNGIKAFKPELISSSSDENSLQKIYKGNNMLFVIETQSKDYSGVTIQSWVLTLRPTTDLILED